VTTRSGARIYRGQSHPLEPGACPQCGRVISINASGKRRTHCDRDGQPCGGSRVFVGNATPVVLDELPDIVMPGPANPWSGRRDPRPDERLCVCGWRPRRKGDGAFVAHRTRPDDPTAPYCPNGAARCY
jgi:hypothetical protein